jgi:hypothetical protein
MSTGAITRGETQAAESLRTSLDEPATRLAHCMVRDSRFAGAAELRVKVAAILQPGLVPST